MSNEQLAQWLRYHPSLSRVDYEEDISKFIIIGIILIYIMYLCLHYCIYHNHDIFLCAKISARVSGPERKCTNTNNIVGIHT